MRNLFTNPSAPTVDCGVAQVDAVTDLCHLVAGFCGALDRHSHLVQPGLAAEPARIGSQRTTQSFGGVDSLAKASYAAMTGREQKKENNVLCYQIRQSFYPGEITPKEANRIGYELAMLFWGALLVVLLACRLANRCMISLLQGIFHLLCGSSQLSLWALFFCLSRLRQSQLYMLRQNEFAICRLLQPSMNYSFIC